MTQLTPALPAHDERVRLRFSRILRSEIVKLVTIRSPWWSIGIVAVLSIGLPLALWLLAASTYSPDSRDAGSTALPSEAAGIILTMPTQFTMLLAMILGAIVVTGEYSTGMIRSTFTAVPRRITLVIAKALVLGVFLTVVSVVIFLLTILVTMPVMAGIGTRYPLDDIGGFWLPLLWTSLFLGACAVMGVSLGFILRSGAGAIAIGVAFLFVLPIALSIVSAFRVADWITDAARYLPSNAAAMLFPSENPDAMSPGIAGLTIALWTLAALAGACLVVRSRDV